MVGDIYLANIFFTDASAAKVRPILLLKLNSFNDVLFMPLTSKLNTSGIIIDNSQLKDGYIPKKSVVVVEKPGVIAQTLLIKKIGTLNQPAYNTVINACIEFLQR